MTSGCNVISIKSCLSFFGLHFISLRLLSGDGGIEWMVFAVKMSKHSDKHLYESQEVEIPLDNTQVTSY